MEPLTLKHFYIPDDQSIYLLSHKDAKKLKDWLYLCEKQLNKLGYSKVELIGSGAFGFVFSAFAADDEQCVFKFSRVTLPQSVQDRMEEEAYMQGCLVHPNIPKVIAFQQIKRQSILAMERAEGVDLEQYSLLHGPLSVADIIAITSSLCGVVTALRNFQQGNTVRPIVHGDIKPSNIVWDENTKQLQLVDWGSSVFAQLDANGRYVEGSVMDLMSADITKTNARLGDVYFIGDDQLNGKLSSPRFDEQGLASTIYALASGQSSRFGRKVIRASCLGLPKMLADCLDAMLSDSDAKRREGGDYLLNNYQHLKHIVLAAEERQRECLLPTWMSIEQRNIETVVYSSRKSFLRTQDGVDESALQQVNDVQFDRYYKNYLFGMGETEKAFISAVSRLGKYPVVGGLAIKWQDDGIYVDSSLKLYNPAMQYSFDRSIDNLITLARAIDSAGVFKSCMFDAKNTLHIERDSQSVPFLPSKEQKISFEKSKISVVEDSSRVHSYFEDGEDPDELLQLPEPLLAVLQQLNEIHHTGCIIFEALPKHLKIHSYYTLLDHSKETMFVELLTKILELVPQIDGLGLSGFMKLPYKDTRFFVYEDSLPLHYHPRCVK